jgi:hypothetical protein
MRPAFRAGAIELQEMIVYLKICLTLDPFQQTIQVVLPLELGRPSTMHTDNGVVVSWRGAKVAMAAIAAVHAPHDAEL